MTTILGVALMGAALLLGSTSNSATWLWLPGALLVATGLMVVVRRRGALAADGTAEDAVAAPGVNTARLLDNFEQRFAELKKRPASPAVLGDLYGLGTQLEQRGRRIHATAVYRHLARCDAGYKDVAARLQKLMDLERAASRRPAGGPGSVAADGAARADSLELESVGAQAAPRAASPARASGPERQSLAGPTPLAKASASNTADGPNAAVAGSAQDQASSVNGPYRLGRYKLEYEIGRGAMGTVYLGRDSAINRQVAIKAIPLAREFSETELADARARFFREAEAAGRLNHPNIVTIYDVGEEHGLAYIAMEYLKGKHLSNFASGATLLEPRKVIELMSRTAAALGFAHKQNVVHRDIKPANLMYDHAGDVLKITDFGIARMTDAGNTRTGIVLGTPSFMSPEQLEGRNVTGHSDLFSLGVTLFQLLTGQLPFRADSMTGLMQQIAEAPHPPLRAIRPDLPDCVQSIIDRALAKTPEARFDTGAQMAAALDDCRARLPSGSP